MNKKFLFGSLAIAGMLFATSCTNDDLIDNPTGNEATIQFNLKTSDALTRAISDGTSANQLVYQVFRVENGSYKKASEIIKIDNFVSGQNVSLQLAKGHEYAVAFWAQNSDAPYSFYTNETEGLGVDMNYGDNNKNGNNAEYRDAFFGSATFNVTGNNAKEVTLYRPFAQVNVGASDYSVITAAGLNVTESSAHFSNVATKLNLISGFVEGSEEIIYTLDAGALYNPNPDKTLTVEGNDYTWLSMCYVLPNSEPAAASTLVATDFKFKTGQGTITLSEGLDNTPIRRNYRTNIIGKVLSSDVDFRVIIDADFQTPDNNVTLWDGESIEPAIDETGAYVIKNANNWVWLTERDTNGKNIKLDADLNFGGKTVKSLVLKGNTSTIDGQRHTISNVVLTYDNTDSFYSIGLMVPSFLNNGVTLTVKDLTVTDVTIDSNGALYTEEGGNICGFAGVIFGDVQSVNQQVNLTNVHVKNAKVKGTQSVAGLVGLVTSGSTLNLANCSVEDSEITNYKTVGESGYVCGLVGKVVGTLNIGSNVAVKNTNITGYYAPVRGARSINAVAATYEKNGASSGTITGTATVTETTNVTALTFNDIVVETAADLQAIAAGFKAGDSYEGKTICIMADIDLAGINWSLAQISNRFFGGTIEGNGHTIRNMKVVDETSQDGSAGFIGWLNGTIRNLNFEDANVEGSHYVGVICGYNQYGTIENCTVNRSKVNAKFKNSDRDGDKCGGAIGYCNQNAQVTVKNVKVTNTAVTARRNAAQVIGYCYPDETTIENLKAENVTVEWNYNTDPSGDGQDSLNITQDLYNH